MYSKYDNRHLIKVLFVGGVFYCTNINTTHISLTLSFVLSVAFKYAGLLP